MLRVESAGGTRRIAARAVCDAGGSAGRFAARPAGGQCGPRSPAPGQPAPFVAFQTHLDATGDGAEEDERAEAAAIQLHTFAGGYCGVNRIESGRETLCALVGWPRWMASPERRPDALLRAMRRENPHLDDALRGRVIDPATWLSIAHAGAARGPEAGRRPAIPLLAVGDAAAMIAPAAGDGISMALRSAEIAADVLLRVLGGDESWEAGVRRFDDAWRREIRGRLRVARFIHDALSRPARAAALAASAALIPPLAGILFRASRGEA